MHSSCHAIVRRKAFGSLCFKGWSHTIKSHERLAAEHSPTSNPPLNQQPNNLYTDTSLLRPETQSNHSHPVNLVQIQNGTFYREHPLSRSQTAGNEIYFPNLTFSIHEKLPQDASPKPQAWAVIGTKNTAKFLEVIRGDFFCDPPTARSYPYLSSEEISKKNPDFRIPSRAIQYVGFGGQTGLGPGIQGAYLSARYESHREETDWTVLQYLQGDTELNASEELSRKLKKDDGLLQQVIRDLHLQKLVSMSVSNLSNGQTRRARIAKALLSRPELLLLDEPFMGLDPPTLISLSPILKSLAFGSGPLLVLALRPQDPVPEWITHMVILDEHGSVALCGPQADQFRHMESWADNQNRSVWRTEMMKKHGKLAAGTGTVLTEAGIRRWSDRTGPSQIKDTQSDQTGVPSSDQLSQHVSNILSSPTAWEVTHELKGEPLVELQNLTLRYGDKTVLGHTPPGLNLTICRGTRLALLGPNGSGKTTLLSLLTSDHPQSYSLPIKFFGRDRLPSKGQVGLSVWDIQARIGHSSPEVHAFFPKHLSVRSVLESAWAETFRSKPDLTVDRNQRVDRVLRWWQPELRQGQKDVKKLSGEVISTQNSDIAWARDENNHAFRNLPFGAQRLLLMLRAFIKQPDILVLDEAFSGLSSEVRDKAMLFLEYGEEYIIHQGQRTQNLQQRGDIIPGLSDQQAMIVVSHIREEIPNIVNEWIRLPSEEEAMENGANVLTGKAEKDGIQSLRGWNKAWGM